MTGTAIGWILLAAFVAVILYVCWRCFVTGEKWLDRLLRQQANFRNTGHRFGAAILIALAIAFGAGLTFPAKVQAKGWGGFPPGTQLAKDWGGVTPAIEIAKGYGGDIVLASTGRVSGKDWCHNSKKLGYRHWHYKKGGLGGVATEYGNKNVAGPCVTIDGKTYRVVMAPGCAEKLSWLVDGNRRYGSRVRVNVVDLDKVARLCLGRPPKP